MQNTHADAGRLLDRVNTMNVPSEKKTWTYHIFNMLTQVVKDALFTAH